MASSNDLIGLIRQWVCRFGRSGPRNNPERSRVLRDPRRDGWSGFESLEQRLLLSAVSLSHIEQYMVELINRSRSDPVAAAAGFGIDLNEELAPRTLLSQPRQPLALNPYLVDAARGHSQWLIDTDQFSHAGAGGSRAGDRIAAAGYASPATFSWAENIG